MLEIPYKKLVAAALRSLGWVVQEHEDKIANFIPDLSFSAHGVKGWVEVKYVDKVPKTGLSGIKHYTAGQRKWLFDNGEAGGGLCYLLLGTATGHRVWPHTALHNAYSGTYMAAQSLCCVRDDSPGDEVMGLALKLDALIQMGRVAPTPNHKSRQR